MKQFKDVITLNRNSRGCYILDTTKGCSGVAMHQGGCYNDCYASKIASRYAVDFSHPIKRDFITSTNQLYFDGFYDESHESTIIREISKIDMPFVRIGEMGDPSDDWRHTINVCKTIARAEKPIVIITKHWKPIPDDLLSELPVLGLCINTSTSALDSAGEREHRLNQFKRLATYCKSVLRVVSCDFNLTTNEGREKKAIQDKLLDNTIIDTVFRPSKNNRFILDKVIHIEKVKFLGASMLASMHNKNTYLGRCDTCPEMCGIHL